MPSMVRIGNGAATIGNSNSQPTDARSAALRSPLAPAAPNEFQKFVLETTGKLLPIFGADFFAPTNNYLPAPATPVSGDYQLGPGDEVLIHGWGSIDIDHRAVIDRNGAISLPKVGTISLAGVRASNAEEVVRNAVGKYYRGFNLNVTLGQLRGITIYVVGQARRPGTYTVSSTSSLVTALFESGGPNANGSLRRVQVKRDGRKVAEMDLYAFLAKGDKSADIKLVDGDVIVIPPAAGFVALTGKVETPAVYELRGSGDSIQSLLDIAGGLPILADPRRVLLERVDADQQLPRSVEEFSLDSAGLAKPLRNGDLVSILSITPEFSNAVTLRGSVNQAMRIPFRSGMKITDVIPNKEFLVSRFAVRRQNRALIAQNARDEQIQQVEFPAEQQQLDRANWLAKNGGRRQDSRNVGMNGIPNQTSDMYGPPKSMEPDEAKRALETARQAFVDSVGNLYDDLNWDYAVVERVSRAQMADTLVPFDLGRALSDPNGPDNVALQPGDTITVFSADDVRIPIAKRRVYVRVEGEVRRPGVYQVAQGESLINVVEKAGGVTSDAYVFGSEFYRDSVRKSQQENLDKFVRRLEQESIASAGRFAANTSTTDPQAAQLLQARLAVETESRNRFLQRLRELRSSGRIALGLPPKEANFAQLPNFRLENGDRLVIPNRPDFVQVFGAVNTESALLWEPGRTVSDYLARSGLTRDADSDGTFVMRADGTVVSNADRWLTSVNGVEVQPGDIIVTPEKLDKETAWTTFTKNAKDITQIFYNLGLGAAAIKTLRD